MPTTDASPPLFPSDSSVCDRFDPDLDLGQRSRRSGWRGTSGRSWEDAWKRAWVDAGPFRAHLRHVMAVGDLTVEDVAQLTGIGAHAARALLHGRKGRPVRRVSAAIGRRLLRLTSADARAAGCRLTPAAAIVTFVYDLLRAGHTVAELAWRLGISADILCDLIEGRTRVCTVRVAARIGSAHAAWEAGRDVWRPTPDPSPLRSQAA
jgi:hypothetical protein